MADSKKSWLKIAPCVHADGPAVGVSVPRGRFDKATKQFNVAPDGFFYIDAVEEKDYLEAMLYIGCRIVCEVDAIPTSPAPAAPMPKPLIKQPSDIKPQE